MKSNYKLLGQYIREVDKRNTGGSEDNLLGVSTNKVFIPSIANTIGTNFNKYKTVNKYQFTYVPDTSRRGDRVGIALLEEYDNALVSSAYTVFEIIDHNKLLPEYLMMWFRRPEFDRYARFKSHGSVREMFDWDEMCNVELPVPDIEKQKAIVKEYNTIVNRIKLNEELNKKLEETAQAIYKQWFVDFEFPNNEKLSFVDSGFPDFGVLPEGWQVVPLGSICSKIGSGSTPKGGKAGYQDSGKAFVRSLNVFDYNFSYKDLAFINDSQAKKLENVKLEKCDVLLNITGVSVARCSIVPQSILPAHVNQHVSIVRLSSKVATPHYLLCALCSTDYKSRLLGISEGGSTRQALTKTDIEKCELLLPDLQVRTKFEKIASCIFKLKEVLTLGKRLLGNVLELLLVSIVSKDANKASVRPLIC